MELGTPITTEQATRALLRMIHSPLVGNIEADASPGYTLQRIKAKDDDLLGGTIYECLSSGERHIVNLAQGVWSGTSELGGLDRASRRTALLILWFFYLGNDQVALADALDEFAEREGGAMTKP